MNIFKLGSVVKLKNSHLKMTIEEIMIENNKIVCVWFENSILKKDTFLSSNLNLIEL